jgi:hypothetical protein
MYESRRQRPIPRRHFLRRLVAHGAVAGGMVGGSLLLGMGGYAYFEHLAWRDAFLNAAMLLGGMGPVDPPRTPGGKLFAGAYALYAGLIFLVAVAIVAAPVFHRLLHQFHWDPEGTDGGARGGGGRAAKPGLETGDPSGRAGGRGPTPANRA